MFKTFKVAALAGVFAAATLAGSVAGAATLSGTFLVGAVNVTNLNSTESRATLSNYLSALELALSGTGAFADGDSVAVLDTFDYTGDIDFRVGGPQKETPYSVEDWVKTGTGIYSGLDDPLASTQLSFPNIGNGSATTTFFLFALLSSDLDMARVTGFDVTHDDGVRFFENGTSIGGVNGPTSVRNTEIPSFGGGTLEILYVATNGNPSILEVDARVSPIPLPAGAWLLLGGLGALGALRRRKAA